MNFQNFGFLIMHVLLEIYVFPLYSKTYINSEFFDVINIILRAYFVKKELPKFSTLNLIFILVIRHFLTVYILAIYYPSIEAPDFFKEILLSSMVLISLACLETKEIDEIKDSQYIPNFNNFFFNIIFTNCLTNYFTAFHLKDLRENTDFSINQISLNAQKALLDILICYGIFIFTILIFN